MDRKYLLIGVCFLFATLLCLIGLLHNGFESYYITGIILFTFIGITFIKKANLRK